MINSCVTHFMNTKIGYRINVTIGKSNSSATVTARRCYFTRILSCLLNYAASDASDIQRLRRNVRRWCTILSVAPLTV